MGRFALILFSLAVFATSCDFTSQKYLFQSTGAPGELIIICEDYYWQTNTGTAMQPHFERFREGLSQPEFDFNIGQYNREQFRDNVKTHRNILYVNISENVKKPEIEFLKDVYAHDQIVIRLNAPDETSLISLFNTHKEKISEIINLKDRERTMDYINSIENVKISKALAEKYNLKVKVPREAVLVRSEKNFAWIKYDRVKFKGGQAFDVDEGILIYTYPYTEDTTFTLGHVLKVRDSVLKTYVFGPSEGSYLSTERDPLFYPVSKETVLNKEYAFEVRGLNTCVNDFYGGPFLSVTTYDAKRKRIVVAEGYVHAPNFHKREFLREVEAMIYSLEFE
jgi:hypothetical protein